MPSSDGPGAGPHGSTPEIAREQVHDQLVEALILLLIEKGVLTKNDALSIVQTVAHVQQGRAEEAPDDAKIRSALRWLESLYLSFDAISDRIGAAVEEGRNVRHLRPPIYDGRPEFPRDD